MVLLRKIIHLLNTQIQYHLFNFTRPALFTVTSGLLVLSSMSLVEPISKFPIILQAKYEAQFLF